MDDAYELILAKSDEEVTSAAALAGQVHGEGIRALTLELVRSFPEPVDILAARHRPTGAIVSLLVLIPWTWRLGAAEIRVIETGIVATHPNHRLRGLGSGLMARAEARRRERGVVFAVIQGIPGFYHRFGHTYAAPLEVHDEWALDALPTCPAGWSCRDAVPDDAPVLTALFAPAAGAPLTAVRTEAHWRFRLGPGRNAETVTDFRIVIDPAGRWAGVWAVAREGFGEGLIVTEAGQAPGFSEDLVWATIAADACDQARATAKPHLRLNLGSLHPLTVWARGRGARRTGTWHWQIRLDAPQAALDQTVSDWGPRWPAGGPTRVVLDLYGKTVVLAASGNPDGPEARANLTPEVLAKLLFGWKDPRALREFHPDFFGDPQALAVIDALFPARDGFCSSVY